MTKTKPVKKFNNSNLAKVKDNISQKDIEQFMNNQGNIALLNIEITTRCNNRCSYCHFYDRKYNRECGLDMDIDLFTKYMEIIKYMKINSKVEVQRRFSGGDPIVLGDKLFEFAKIGYKITGIKPYLLTAGKGISKDWINKARKSCLTNAFISVENPLDPDKGANKVENVINSINKYDDDDFRLLLGVCIIKNKWFAKSKEICDYFYKETNQIPTIHELNYGQFKTPNKRELNILKEQLELIIKNYGKDNILRLFPSVFPELSFGKKMVFLSDLPIVDKYGLLKLSPKEQLEYLAKRFISFSYPKNNCELNCELKQFCSNIKWFWLYNTDGKFNKERFKTYCTLKKILFDLYIDYFDLIKNN